MPTLPGLIKNNRLWARRTRERDPGFFTRLARKQQPTYFWIGCSDSRVPATLTTGLLPGELFVHRNVANLVREDDIGVHAAIHYAVRSLDVSHVLVVGHYGCGGVASAMEPDGPEPLAEWLEPVRRIAAAHAAELGALPAPEAHDRLCELNTVAQADRLADLPIIRQVWAEGRHLEVHTWMYHIESGLLRPLRDVIDGPDTVPVARAAEPPA